MLEFSPHAPPDKRVTKVWHVTCRGTGLGWVEWHAPWRRYVFKPSDKTLLDASCLEELREFTSTQTLGRKAERKQEKP